MAALPSASQGSATADGALAPRALGLSRWLPWEPTASSCPPCTTGAVLGGYAPVGSLPSPPRGCCPARGVSSQPGCPGTTGTIVCEKRVAKQEKDTCFQHLLFCKVTFSCAGAGGAAGSRGAALPMETIHSAYLAVTAPCPSPCTAPHRTACCPGYTGSHCFYCQCCLITCSWGCAVGIQFPKARFHRFAPFALVQGKV